jgi:hypothetical protein
MSRLGRLRCVWLPGQRTAALGVRQAVADESGDLGFLGAEPAPRLDRDSAGGLAGGQELSRGPLGEPLGAASSDFPLRVAASISSNDPQLES